MLKIGDKVIVVDIENGTEHHPIFLDKIGRIVTEYSGFFGVDFKEYIYGKDKSGDEYYTHNLQGTLKEKTGRYFTPNQLELYEPPEMKLLDDPEYEGMFI